MPKLKKPVGNLNLPYGLPDILYQLAVGRAAIKSGLVESVATKGRQVFVADNNNGGNCVLVQEPVAGNMYDIKFYDDEKVDALTGLPGKELIGDKAGKVINDKPVVFVFIDLDGLKEINDTYGHSAGDIALKSTSDLLKERFHRKDDYLFKYGGDEIVAILSDTVEKNAIPMLESIREELSTLPCILNEGTPEEKTITITASFGVKTYVPDGCEIDDREAVINREIAAADNAMYISKRNGGNRITTASGYTTPDDKIGSIPVRERRGRAQ